METAIAKDLITFQVSCSWGDPTTVAGSHYVSSNLDIVVAYQSEHHALTIDFYPVGGDVIDGKHAFARIAETAFAYVNSGFSSYEEYYCKTYRWKKGEK